MKYKITWYSRSAAYSEIVDEGDFAGLHDGDWTFPFPNEEGHSLAFGLMEYFLQSDASPELIKMEGICRIKVDKLHSSHTECKNEDSLEGEAVKILHDIIKMHCQQVTKDGDTIYDSMSNSIYADALMLLDRIGVIQIIKNNGRRIIAKENTGDEK